MIRVIISILLLAIINPSVVTATDHYLDGAVATSGDGLSWSTAWKTWANIVWSSVLPGDTLYISGGSTSQTYLPTAEISPTSGTVGNHVVIRPGQDVGHNGVVVIDGSNSSSHMFEVRNKDYITFDGEYNGENHIILKNWASLVSAGQPRYAISGYGASSDTSGFVVRHISFINEHTTCSVANCSDMPLFGAIYLATPGEKLIENSYFEGCIRLTIKIAGSTTDYDKAIVRNNVITGFKRPIGSSGGIGGPDLIQASSGVTIENNLMYHTVLENAEYNPSHTAEDGIQIITASKVRARNNILYDVAQSAIRADVYGMQDIEIENNVIFRNSNQENMQGIMIELDGSGEVSNSKIVNNTIVDYATGLRFVGGSALSGGVSIYNNLILGGSFDVTIPSDYVSEMGIDHNLVLYSPTSRRDVTVNSAPFSQQHDPFDGNEVLGLTSYTQYGGVGNNLAPTSPSMIVNAGVSIAGITPVVDKNGAPRDSQPDIGAYEYGGAIAHPGRWRNFRFVPAE